MRSKHRGTLPYHRAEKYRSVLAVTLEEAGVNPDFIARILCAAINSHTQDGIDHRKRLRFVELWGRLHGFKLS